MVQPRKRRSGLFDLLILVAGVAFGLWLLPQDTVPVFRMASEVLAGQGLSRLTVSWASRLLIMVQPTVAVVTVTLLGLAFRRCRSRRRLTTRPGSSACLAATLAMLIVVPLSWSTSRLILVGGLPITDRSRIYLGEGLTFKKAECGVAVATAWLALAIGGRWRPRAEAIDRAGVVIGCYWVATIPAAWLR